VPALDNAFTYRSTPRTCVPVKDHAIRGCKHDTPSGLAGRFPRSVADRVTTVVVQRPSACGGRDGTKRIPAARTAAIHGMSLDHSTGFATACGLSTGPDCAAAYFTTFVAWLNMVLGVEHLVEGRVAVSGMEGGH